MVQKIWRRGHHYPEAVSHAHESLMRAMHCVAPFASIVMPGSIPRRLMFLLDRASFACLWVLPRSYFFGGGCSLLYALLACAASSLGGNH